jgi:hypothetical protein
MVVVVVLVSGENSRKVNIMQMMKKKPAGYIVI